MYNKRCLGSAQEKRAENELWGRGYVIISRNYFSSYGEIDLICKKDEYLVFVEVKYRSGETYGLPQEAVDYRKQRRICNAASYYLYEHHLPMNTPCRFDVVAISNGSVEVIENAFPYCGAFDQ